MDKARKKKPVKLAEEVVRLLKLKQKNAAFHQSSSEIEYDSSFGRVRQPVLILRSQGICTDCGREGSQYFEAIIQLRGAPNRVEKMADVLSRKLQKTTFIPKMEELKEGIDIYTGSRNDAIAALNAFSLGFLRTEKLAGQRQGRRLYRTTLLVRL
jgi:NMD protein affecting ribosome stability and mRNA decay